MENSNESEKDITTNKVPNRGKFLGGLIIVAIGVILLLRESGVAFPEWLFSWKVILIVVGFYTGVKHSFRNPSWIIMMFVGGIFLAEDILGDFTISAYIWPLVIILAGLFIMFKPHRKYCNGPQWQRWEHKWRDKWEWDNMQGHQDSNDFVESVSVFAGVKKHIITKSFKGGELTCVFGGMEVNLMQADFTGTAVLEVTQIFGGTKLIVPAHWEIHHHDLVAVMGGIEDKRPVRAESIADSGKVLVLRGTCFFGGIEIKSYA